MLLRIIDISEQQETKDCVEIIFIAPDQSTITYKSEYFPSLYTKNFSSMKDWYFEKYQLDSPKNDQNFISRYISLGQNMGDKLLGDDSEIYKIVKIIEENQYQHLFVTIESKNPSFFKEQWETIVFPESKYILSSTVKGFFRTYQQQDSAFIFDKIQADEDKSIDNNVQLKILNIIVGGGHSESYAYDIFVDSLRYNDLFIYESLYFENAESFREASKNIAFIPDILIFNGDIVVDDFEKNLNGKYVSQSDIFELIKFTDAEFIIINSSFYSHQDAMLDRELGLAKLATHIIEKFDKAVLGFSNSSQFWVYSYCIKLVLEKLASGLSLGQSVVEVRKSIQKKQEYNDLSITPIPFQPWSILQFYGINNSKFVSTSYPKVNINDSDRFKTIRSKLHGFINEHLPPNAVTLAEHSFPLAIANLQQYKSLSIIAPQGYGKSQLAHDIALFMVYKGIEKAFRFDFSKDSYTSSTMLEMIANTVDQPTEEPNKIYEALTTLESIFVFDNIDSKEMSNNIENINNFIAKLKGNNIFIFTMCKDQELPLDFHPSKLYLPKLPAVGKLILGAEKFRTHLEGKNPEDIDEIYQKFISTISIPFLIKKLPPILLKSNDNQIKENLYIEFCGHELDNCINRFYSWGFSQLNEVTKNLFVALKGIKGIYLEVLNSTLFSGQGFQPATQFLELLGNRDADYSKCLEELEMFDFLTRHSYGRTINEDSLTFLDTSVDSINNSSDQEISTFVSLILCESVRRVISHLNKNQNQAISFNLLANRGLLAVHMEALWYAEECDQFEKTLTAIDNFLKQNGIHDEIAEWSYHLLKNQSCRKLNLIIHSKFATSHLKLAIYALTENNFKDETIFSDIVSACDDWIISGETIRQDEFFEINLYCFKFLEKYYLLGKNYKKLIKVSEVMLDIFIKNKIDQFSISTIKIIIHCSAELKDYPQCEKYELLLLNSILKDKDIPDFVCQQLQLSVVSNRISRGDCDLASSLLNKIEETCENNPNMKIPIDLLKADIAHLKNNFYEACKVYSVTLSTLYSQHQDIKQFEFIIEKLKIIRGEIGKVEFNKILDEHDVSSIIDLIEPMS